MISSTHIFRQHNERADTLSKESLQGVKNQIMVEEFIRGSIISCRTCSVEKFSVDNQLLILIVYVCNDKVKEVVTDHFWKSYLSLCVVQCYMARGG